MATSVPQKRSGRPVSAAGRYLPPSEGIETGPLDEQAPLYIESRDLRRWSDTMSSKGAAAGPTVKGRLAR